MKKCLIVITALYVTCHTAFADPLQDCRTDQFVVQETQKLRYTMGMGENEATKEVTKRLKAGDYSQYGIKYDPDNHPSVIAYVFWTYEPGMHHLAAADDFYAGCVDGVMNEGDEGDEG